MIPALPDPIALSRQQAATIKANRDYALKFPIDRILADARQIARNDLLAGLADFHRERMRKVPSAVTYPESKPWVEHILAVDRELQSAAALSDDELAVYRSLNSFVTFRGFRQAALKLRPQPAGDEKCRAAYFPETDRGELVVKNVDDPLDHWKPDPNPPRVSFELRDLRSDGVGNGLHIDDEPDEIFPLNPGAMLGHYCNDVPSVVQFLTRYSKFWGNSNRLFHDKQERSAAIEKCSFNHIEVFHPGAGADGKSYISGMTCRDPNSPQGRYQSAQRLKYLQLFGLSEDGPDMAFWNGCAKFQQKLSSSVAALGPRPRCEDVFKLFTTRWPEGLNKYGLRLHPDAGLVGYTLIINAMLITERKFFRWQRSADGKTFDAQPQVCTF